VVTIPHRIPAGFHGNWVPTQQRVGQPVGGLTR